MLEINRILGTGNVLNQGELKKVEQQQEDVSLLEQGGGVDTVSFSGTAPESAPVEGEETVPAADMEDGQADGVETGVDVYDDTTAPNIENEQVVDAEAETVTNTNVYVLQLEDQIAHIQAKIAAKEESIETIKETLSQCSQGSQLYRKLTAQIEELEQEIAELQRMLEALNEELSSVNSGTVAIGNKEIESDGDNETGPAEEPVSPLMEFVDKYRMGLEDEIEYVTDRIANIDKEIEEVKSDLSKFFKRLFNGGLLKTRLARLEQDRDKYQARLDALNEELERVDAAKETPVAERDAALGVYVGKYRQNLENEATSISEQLTNINKRIENVEEKLSKWFYRFFNGRNLNTELNELKQEKEKLQARLDELNEEMGRIDNATNPAAVREADVAEEAEAAEEAAKAARREELMNEAAEMEVQIEKVSQEIAEAKKELSNCRKLAFFKRRKINKQIANLEDKKASMQKILDKIQEELSQLQPEGVIETEKNYDKVLTALLDDTLEPEGE